MRTIQSTEPRRELREFVRVFAQRTIPHGTCSAQSNVATLEQVIGFYLGGDTQLVAPNGTSKLAPDVTVFGSLTYPCGGATFSGNVIGFAMFLRPLGLQQLFRAPGAELTNEACDGRALLGKGIEELLYRLAERASFEERVQVAERFLLPLAINARARNLVMKTAAHIIQRKGAVRIDELARHTGLGLRQYERRFVDELGMTPKLFSRITRFQLALDTKRLERQRSWLSIAHEFGYFDQAHMVHDFQNLSGEVPGQTLIQSGDLQPWSVAAPMELMTL
jgi:AraC-like DNA-binding protein